MRAEFLIQLDTGESLTSAEALALAEIARRQRIPSGQLAANILREWLKKEKSKP